MFNAEGVRPFNHNDTERVVEMIEIAPYIHEVNKKGKEKVNSFHQIKQEWRCLCGIRGKCMDSTSKMRDHLLGKTHMVYIYFDILRL